MLKMGHNGIKHPSKLYKFDFDFCLGSGYMCQIFIRYKYINVSVFKHNCNVQNDLSNLSIVMYFQCTRKISTQFLFWFQAIFVGKKLGFSVFLLDLLTIVDNQVFSCSQIVDTKRTQNLTAVKEFRGNNYQHNLLSSKRHAE